MAANASASGMPFFTNATTGATNWYSFWALWPSGSFDPNISSTPFVQPSDTTLVRTIISVHSRMSSGSTGPVLGCWGLIAFDGGRNPDLYDNNTGGTDALIAPPCPISDPGDDWIIRVTQPLATGSGTSSANGDSETFNQSRARRKLPPGMGVLAVYEVLDLLSDTENVFDLAFMARFALRSGYTVPNVG